MKKVKVVKIDSEEIEFENGIKLYSAHESDCSLKDAKQLVKQWKTKPVYHET